MTTSYEVPINRYVANGITSTYFFTFFINDVNDVDVYVNETLKVLTTDYVVNGIGDGNSITFVVPPGAGTTVTLVRVQPNIRLVDYAPFGPLNNTALNEDFDRLTRQDQDFAETLAETLKVGPYDAPASLIIPIVANRAGKVLSFDNAGNVVVGQIATILSGIGAPVGGTNGDIYIDTNVWNVYRNVNGTWVLVGNIKGGVGPAGPAGIGMVSAYIDLFGHLIIVLSNTSLIDAGSVVGPTGATGATGAPGATGATGAGVPVGGTTNQVLAKIDAADFDTHWIDPPPATTTLTGDVSGTGVGTIPTTLADSAITPGTYNQLTISRKGIATAGSVIHTAGELYVEQPGNKIYPVLSYSPRAMTINSIFAKTSSGTVTVAIKINGTNVTGLSAVAVTSTGASTNASGANTVNIGDRITVVTSSNASSADLEVCINVS